ncbi:MAG: metallophosphoesterase [Alphaproteobacteria bacterium]|nr:metallophosphoesterase [Alphaproteobacteria bacterium]
MLVAQLSDTHLKAGDDGDPCWGSRENDLRACVADIMELEGPVDCVLHTGDIAQFGRQEDYTLVSDVVEPLASNFFPVPGNRDHRSGLASKFLGSRMPRQQPFIIYAVDEFPVRLIGFDTLSAETMMGDLDEPRLAALDEILAVEGSKPTALFMHHPPFDVPGAEGCYKFQYDRPEAVDAFWQVLGRHPNVVRLFCGHAHRLTETTVNGVVCSTMPSVATDKHVGELPNEAIGKTLYMLHRFDERSNTFESSLRIVQGEKPSVKLSVSNFPQDIRP